MAFYPPSEVPQGAIRLNTDSQKLEFYAQDQWWQMATDVPTLNGGGRGLFAGMTPDASGHTDAIDYITIPTAGNATDFGNLTAGRTYAAGVCNSTRGVFGSGGGYQSGILNYRIDYVTIASAGNATDFGEPLHLGNQYSNGGSTQTRGVWCGGSRSPGSPDVLNTMSYVTIATTGNAIDFGELTISTRAHAVISDSHGGLGGF